MNWLWRRWHFVEKRRGRDDGVKKEGGQKGRERSEGRTRGGLLSYILVMGRVSTCGGKYCTRKVRENKERRKKRKS